MSTEQPGFRAGFVTIAGRPNVGKSTLLNVLLGTAVSIVTPKAQTTRHRIVGVYNRDDAQVVFVDTPGIHQKTPRVINKLMNRAAYSSIEGADVALLVLDALRWDQAEDAILRRMQEAKLPIVVAINKVDTVTDRKRLLPFIAALSQKADFAGVVPISATRGTALDALVNELVALLPESPPLYPPDQITDRSPKFQAAEIIREKLMWQLRQELPYGIEVEIERFEEGEQLEIGAVIWVERKGQKKIVIGHGGSQLKKIGTSARRAIERRMGKTVDLRLWVRHKANWSDDARALRRFGYE